LKKRQRKTLIEKRILMNGVKKVYGNFGNGGIEIIE